jgi:glycosyltransferase involved in cell wall biosynthesis
VKYISTYGNTAVHLDSNRIPEALPHNVAGHSRVESLYQRQQLRFSIVIPTLNEEKILPQVLRQFSPALCTKYAIEIIISDGGSTDHTLDIAKEYTDIVVINETLKRQTIAEGRNRGADAASGNILIFLNADTLFASPHTFFATLMKTFQEQGNDALAFPIHIFPQERTIFDLMFHATYNQYIRILNFVGLGMGRGECQAMRKSTFDSVNGYNESLTAGEDFDLYRRIRKKDKILFVSNLIVYESPRRYRKFGYREVVWSWFKNAISVMFVHKSVSDTWEQVR